TGGMGGAGGLGGMGGGYPGVGGYPGGMNPLGTIGGAGGTFGQGSATGQGRSSFASRLQGIVRGATAGAAGDIAVIGQTKIIADERTNSLLVFAAKEDVKTIKDIIAKLDVVLPQVLIEAIIMEVSVEDTLQYGF